MFKVGDRVRLTAEGERQYFHQAGLHAGTVLGKTSEDSDWFDVKWDNEHTNNYEIKDLELYVEVSDVTKEPQPRVKYLYSVQDADGNVICNTQDRECARESKAYMGGKKEGIVIMAYAPVKEIR